MPAPLTEIILARDGAELARSALRPGQYTIGCSEAADLVVRAEGLSEAHARITVTEREVFVEHLAGAGEIVIGGRAASGRVRLWPGQRAELGCFSLSARRVPLAADGTLSPHEETVRRALPEQFRREKKYELGGVVAQGGMGAILDAHDATTGRTVAMKVMLPGLSEDDLLRFIEEAQITSQLEHPNIVPIYELDVDDSGQVFYTMKFVRGVTLQSVLEALRAGEPAASARYPLPALLNTFQKVCDAVAFAHSRGVLHRDLKPGNVMLGDFGEVLVMDWGLAKVRTLSATATGGETAPSYLFSARREQALSATLAGSIVGTPQYMAPEQARGETETLDARADIYGLGAMLFHLLTLRPPLEGDALPDLLESAREGRIAPLRAVNPRRPVPESLAAVTRKAMALERAGRYASVEELQSEVAAYLSGFAPAAEQAGAWRQLTLLIGRHRAVAATVLLGLLIIAGLASWFVVKVTHERSRAEAEAQRARRALADLRSQAPAFASMAEAYVGQLDLPAALAKLDSALQLDPRHAAYHARRGDLLQTTFRFAESAAAYRQARSLGEAGPRLADALALSTRLAATTPPGQAPGAEALAALHALLLQGHRLAEAVVLAPRLAGARDLQRATYAARLEQSHPGATGVNFLNRFKPAADGRYDVDLGTIHTHPRTLEALRGVPMRSLFAGTLETADLSPLAGLPLESLELYFSKVTSLAPLRGLPLRRLILVGAPLASLEGIEGCPLTTLDISGTHVRNLTPLAGAPLQYLSARGTEVIDLTPLAGMPLETLLISTAHVRSLGPLRDMKLRRLDVSANQDIDDLGPLKGMPLEELNISSLRMSDLSPLAGLPLKRLMLDVCKSVSSFASLRHAPLEYLNIRGTRASDFEFLAGLKLKGLNACNTGFSDGAVLRGAPIEVLLLSGCRELKDVSFLKDLPNLRALALPRELIPVARELPGLLFLSSDDVADSAAPTLESVAKTLPTAQKFWAEYDRSRSW